MVGSGTTVLLASLLGHTAVGYDQDPLALLISKTWCSDLDESQFRAALASTLAAAKNTWMRVAAYPASADSETKEFLRYWFDLTTRKKLAALAAVISRTKNDTLRTQLWCAFSRLIIVKDNGVSLARDVSHSRPHRFYERAPVNPFFQFSKSGEHIIRSLLALPRGGKRVRLEKADARRPPTKAGSIDFVLTSPHYLDAIDYLRGHRMTLAWMGYTLKHLRQIRGSAVGAEIGYSEVPEKLLSARQAVGRLTRLDSRTQRIVNKYVVDMNDIMGQIARVLRPRGKAVIVIGNSTLRGVFLKNSDLIIELGRMHGLELVHRRWRQIPRSKRYLPPPCSQPNAAPLASRMRAEVVLTFSAIGKGRGGLF